LTELASGFVCSEPRGPIVAKHERANEMFYLDRVKPWFSRDPELRFRDRMQSSVDGILR
jgi:hypothetical protein